MKKAFKLELGYLIILFISTMSFVSLFSDNVGVLGNLLSNILSFAFGCTRYIVPVAYMSYSILMLKTRKIKYRFKLVLFFLTLFTYQGILSIADIDSGKIGFWIGLFLTTMLGNNISILFLVLLKLFTLSFIFDIQIKNLCKIFSDDNIKLAKPRVQSIANDATEMPIASSNISFIEYEKIINDGKFFNTKPLEIPIGIDVTDKIIYADIAIMPHLLIAGMTGSGKSMWQNTLLCSLILTNQSSELKLVIIDLKRTEFVDYKNVAHLLYPIAVELNDALNILKNLVAEMERRFVILEESKSRNIDVHNSKSEYSLPRIVVMVDEYADLFIQSKDIEPLVLRLAQKSRSCGIHLIVATQRPDKNIINGTVKANLPSRISFAVASSTDSRIILDSNGAEQLSGDGELLLKIPSKRTPKSLRGAMLSDKTLETIIASVEKIECEDNNALYELRQEIDSFFDIPLPVYKNKLFKDNLCEEVLLNAVIAGEISISSIVAAFSVGATRATKIFNEIRTLNILIPPSTTNGKHKLKIKSFEEWEDFKRTYKAA